MENSIFLGLDVGTTNIKAILVDSHGNEVAKAEVRNPPTITEDGYSETDMHGLFERCCTVIKTVLSEQNSACLAAMSVSGQGEGLWALDEYNQPIGPAILWNDGRASRTASQWLNHEGVKQIYQHTTGSVPFSGATSVLLAWFKKHERNTYDRIKTVFWCKDWIRYCLTGAFSSDPSDASTSMLSLETKGWAHDLLAALDIEEVKQALPALRPSNDIAGYVQSTVAQMTGLPEGLPVATGALDIVATAFGMGAHQQGDTCVILGTTCCCESLYQAPKYDSNTSGGWECFEPSSLVVNVNAAMAGTPNLDWAIGSLLTESERQRSDVFEFIEANIKALDPVSRGVIFHPYIAEAGERAPFNNPGAKAQFFGIDTKTTRWDMLKSVYEGVAFSIRDCIGEGTGRILLAGGGAKSEIWPQIIADCTGRSVVIAKQSEACSNGSIMYAFMAVNPECPAEQVIAKFNGEQRAFTPNKHNTDIYEAYFEVYKEIRTQLDGIWKIHDGLKNQRTKHERL
ncbi:carbohydrate kinase [Vibrio sinensis]|uniref:Carbohydrate kinase n=1 Tax=Vibrio sinensis TaxID=2302434 RepID=A0A3A6R2V2_9VIBR|nr:FGGY-family carbohydrate kinase [Vibrio sinensis]RJX75199.1 carbohydrate kinase [Vibrio sinensis]